MFSSAFVVLREKKLRYGQTNFKLNLQSTNMHGFKFSIASDKTKDDSLLQLHRQVTLSQCGRYKTLASQYFIRIECIRIFFIFWDRTNTGAPLLYMKEII